MKNAISLILDLKEVVDGSKKGKKFMSKYNIGIQECRELFDILAKKTNETISANIERVLTDYNISHYADGIGWIIERGS